MSFADVELVAAFASEFIDHSSSFALGVAAICAFLCSSFLIPTEEGFGAVARKGFGDSILNAGHHFHVEVSEEHLFQIRVAFVDNFYAQPV